MGMDLSQQILSDITIHMKYAKYLPHKNRRETWEELVSRNKNMHIKKFPELKDEIEDVYKLVYDKKILPSMRSMQFAGKPIEISPNRIFNCGYLPMDDWRAFSEIMFLLLGGTGIGFSVQKHHVDNLPEIRKPNSKRSRRFLVGDSIEGWSDAIKILMKSYFGISTSTPIFDFSDIRQKGASLVTSGGKAPGPQPLKDCIHNIQGILDSKIDGTKLTTLEVHDIVCHIADAVLAGGIRRAALISLFSFDDQNMLTCKFGNWWETNPQRGRANNSVVLLRHKIHKEDFMSLWEKIEASNSGEPGIFFSNDKDWGVNPSLRKGTKVITSDGIFPIEQLQDKEFKVKNLNGELSDAKCWLSGRNQKLYKLTLNDGSEYFCTKEHKWPIWDGEKYIKLNTPDIKEGDKLPFLREEKLFDGTLGTYSDGFLCGWIIGDGWVSNRYEHSEYGMIVSNKDDESNISDILIETLRKGVPSFNGNFKERFKNADSKVNGEIVKAPLDSNTKEISINNKLIDNYIKQFGVVNKIVGLPEAVWVNGSEDYRKGIIDGLFSSDGHIEKNKKRISLTSKHKELLNDVSELLGFYGIKTTIKKHYSNLNGKNFISFVLKIDENQSIKQFIKIFKLSVKHKQERLDSYKFKNTKSNNQISVSSVEETDLYEDVWDISVYDNSHCFQLSKVITGNCGEIGLRPNQFCNLVEVNVSDVETQEELNLRVKGASFIGTLQASYTEFHYLRDVWQKNTEKEALIGVGMTGIASGRVLKLDLKEASRIVKEENVRVADMIGINHAARTTTLKPSGSSSLVLGTSSGIHGWHNDFYIRRIRVGKNEAIYTYLAINHPELLEDEYFRPHENAIIVIPQKAPENAIYRYEKPIKLLERVKKFNLEWVRGGHVSGENTNNVSVTVSITKEYNKRDENGIKTIKKNEWPEVGEWMWENRETFNGISVLPYDGGSYIQAPFTNCTEETYNEMMKSLTKVDLSKVIELDDNTDLRGELACGSGGCELK